MDSADGAFKIKLGGRIMNDWAFMTENSAVRNDPDPALGDQVDGTEFRRARLYVSGTVYEKLSFKVQYDFAGGDADFKDVWMGVKLPKVGLFKVGHYKEAFGLEQLTSSKYITFMERSLPDIFTPGRNTGFSLSRQYYEDRLTWSLGAFRETDGFGDAQEEGGFNFTGRVTGIPWREAKDKFVHVGVAASRRSPTDDERRFRQRPEGHLADYFVDTDTITGVDGETRFGAEVAMVHGPYSVQGEFMLSMLDAVTGSDPSFTGYYVMGSWFPFGGSRPFKGSTATFSRVKPAKNFLESDDECGAWELALRYSHLDLNHGSSGVAGGELSDITLGINWYLNPNTRVMWNYVRADVDLAREADLFLMRFQIDF